MRGSKSSPGVMMRNFVLGFVGLLSFGTCSAAQAKTEPQPAKKVVVLKAAQIFDSNAGKYMTAQAGIIEGDRLTQVAPAASLQVAAGGEVVDLGSATLIPGL